MGTRPNQTFLVIAEPDPAPQDLAVVTNLAAMAVVIPADTALAHAAMEDIVTEAHLLPVDTMKTTTVVATVPHPEAVLQSMTTHLPAVVVVSMILTAVTTLRLILMSTDMADLPQETTLPEITLLEMPVMPIMTVAVIGKWPLSNISFTSN